MLVNLIHRASRIFIQGLVLAFDDWRRLSWQDQIGRKFSDVSDVIVENIGTPELNLVFSVCLECPNPLVDWTRVVHRQV